MRLGRFAEAIAPLESALSAQSDALDEDLRVGGGLQLTYGLRAEFGALTGAPAYNPQVEQLFGRRTDLFPRETQLSPRAGFTWMIGSGGGRNGPPGFSPLIVRGGIGLFRSPLPGSLAGLARAATGLSGSEGQLFCVGEATPPADWAAYLADPSTIPTECASSGPSPVVRRRAVKRCRTRTFSP